MGSPPSDAHTVYFWAPVLPGIRANSQIPAAFAVESMPRCSNAMPLGGRYVSILNLTFFGLLF